MKTIINDNFWSTYQQLVRDEVIPYQWTALNDEDPTMEPTNTINNFRIAAGEIEGEFHGMRFQDSDLAKWLETVGYTLAIKRDEDLEKIADEVIELIERAQHPDGYINTYFTVAKPGKRWTNLHNDHELYCAGHLIEAAVAYYKATGKSKIIDIVTRFADYIDTVFGPEEDKIQGYDAHPEIELALIKLYHVTENKKYLELSKFFVEERGRQNPHFFDEEAKKNPDNFVRHPEKDYSQAHIPLREQKTAEGHAVRAMYLYTAMADLAKEYQDEQLYEICQKIWKNVVTKRMYITGGIGSQAYGERFTIDYDLPNDRSYTETCAAIGLVFWAKRMLELSPEGQYADVMERALYNGVISGMSQDGKRYFYVNPLEVNPAKSEFRQDLSHVKHNRQPWFGCACCPPNISRLIASLNSYLYTQEGNEIYAHLYVSNESSFQISQKEIQMKQESNYPWDGEVRFTLSMEQETDFTLALRLPGWCDRPALMINGEKVSLQALNEQGYAKIKRTWKNGDKITLILSMDPKKIISHPAVQENVGKIALQRGPIVYCLEEIDNGKNLAGIILDKSDELKVEYFADDFKGIPIITTTAKRLTEEKWNDQLYLPANKLNDYLETFKIKAVPYFLWNNRGSGEMVTWINAE